MVFEICLFIVKCNLKEGDFCLRIFFKFFMMRLKIEKLLYFGNFVYFINNFEIL